MVFCVRLDPSCHEESVKQFTDDIQSMESPGLLLSIGPRPRHAVLWLTRSPLAKLVIGAKSLDHDLGDVHTWPHYHYPMRKRVGIGGWSKSD